MGEKGVPERAENTPLWGPRVEMLFSTFTTWGRPVRKSRTELHTAANQRPRASSLMMSLEGTMVLNAEL
jgi:hypothetical protein